jgi:LysM repeat protein
MDWLRRTVVRTLLVGLWTVSLFTLVYPARAQAQGGGGGVHTVEAGETLASIARQYNTDVATLLAENGLSNPNLVYVGQQLVVSGGGSWQEPSYEQEPRYGSETAQNWQGNYPPGTSWEPQPSQTNSYPAGRSWEPEASDQGYNRAGMSYDPSGSQGAGTAWEPQSAQASPYSEQQNWGSEPQRGSPQRPESEWDWVHDNDSPYFPGSSWEPPQTVRGPNGLELTGEKWIDIDISDQTLTAYQGDTAIRYFSISSGSSRYPTVQGTFYTYSRTELQDMSGGSEAAGDYYYQPDVPWVQYFFEGYAIHGAYWHNQFGTPIGHGCINMRVDESQWLYEWTGVTGIRVEVHQ